MLFTFKKSRYFKFTKDYGIIDKILIVYFSINILPNHCGYSFPFVQFKQNLWQIDCSANCRSSISSIIKAEHRAPFLGMRRDAQRATQASVGCRTNWYAKTPRADWSSCVTYAA